MWKLAHRRWLAGGRLGSFGIDRNLSLHSYPFALQLSFPYTHLTKFSHSFWPLHCYCVLVGRFKLELPTAFLAVFIAFLNMLSSRPPTLLSLLAIVLSSTHTSYAKPLLRDDTRIEPRNSTLELRCVGTPCGWTGTVCCDPGQTCFTDSNNQAQCGTSSGGGGNQENNDNSGQWQLYTTTYVETDLVTRTTTYSSYVGAASSAVVAPTQELVPAPTAVTCNTSVGEGPCGSICCAVGQWCQYQGQCAAVGGGGDFSSSYYSSVTGSAFIRPTSNGVETITSTGSPTTTVPFQTPTSTSDGSTAGMEASTTNNGLSGGAIAGIVIGVLIGLGLLFLLCACFCFRGLLDGLLSLFGLGPKRRRREETYIEERHSTRHSGGGGGSGGRTWFGTRPSRVDRPKKSGGFGGFTAIATGLAALAVVLGLKRRKDRRDKSSYGTGSTYSYSDYTSSSKQFSLL